MRLQLTLASLACALTLGAARADEIIDSSYTTHDYEKCREGKPADNVRKFRCEGHVGTLVNVSVAEDSTTLDFGFQGDKDDAWPFASAHVFASGTIEWRGRVRTGKMTPYAAIVRYEIRPAISEPSRPALYVYHIKGLQGSCIVGSIDATHADANQRARRLADEVSAGFHCGTDKPRPME